MLVTNQFGFAPFFPFNTRFGIGKYQTITIKTLFIDTLLNDKKKKRSQTYSTMKQRWLKQPKRTKQLMLQTISFRLLFSKSSMWISRRYWVDCVVQQFGWAIYRDFVSDDSNKKNAVLLYAKSISKSCFSSFFLYISVKFGWITCARAYCPH